MQARELGHVLASEWRQPRSLSELPALDSAPTLTVEGASAWLPDEFPRGHHKPSHPATLCFTHPMSGRWHRLPESWFWQVERLRANGHWWPLMTADGQRWPLVAAGGRWWPLVTAGDR